MTICVSFSLSLCVCVCITCQTTNAQSTEQTFSSSTATASLHAFQPLNHARARKSNKSRANERTIRRVREMKQRTTICVHFMCENGKHTPLVRVSESGFSKIVRVFSFMNGQKLKHFALTHGQRKVEGESPSGLKSK